MTDSLTGEPVILSKPIIDDAAIAAVERVMRSGMLAAGPEVAAFEREFAEWTGVDHAIAVSNGTLALWVGLLACGIEPGDEVIVPSFTFAGTASAVIMAGAKPVYADIDPATYCITSATVASVITGRTRAVMPVHLYGYPAPMPELDELCRAHDLLLFEDAAQAHGAAIGDRRVGSWGSFGAFSFYPTKNMTTGEGGMITTNDPAVDAAARRIRNHGMEQRYHHIGFGTNARLTDLGAAIGRAQLARIDEWTERRIENAATLSAALHGMVETPPTIEHGRAVFHQYTVATDDRPRLLASLEAHRIGHGIYYPAGCHQQPAYRDADAVVPETETAGERVVSLPVRPDLTGDELDRIITAVKEAS